MRLSMRLAKSVCGLAAALTVAWPGAAFAQQNCFLGEIRYFGSDKIPRNWHRANGATLQIASYQGLFAILSTTYGGDGRTTFKLPNLQGRTSVSPSDAPTTPNVRLGERGGYTQLTIVTSDNIPIHSHSATTTISVRAAGEPGTISAPAPTVVLASPGPDVPIYDTDLTDPPEMVAGMITATTDADPFGAERPQPFNNIQPSLVLTPMICIDGVSPSRP